MIPSFNHDSSFGGEQELRYFSPSPEWLTRTEVRHRLIEDSARELRGEGLNIFGYVDGGATVDLVAQVEAKNVERQSTSMRRLQSALSTMGLGADWTILDEDEIRAGIGLARRRQSSFFSPYRVLELKYARLVVDASDYPLRAFEHPAPTEVRHDCLSGITQSVSALRAVERGAVGLDLVSIATKAVRLSLLYAGVVALDVCGAVDQLRPGPKLKPLAIALEDINRGLRSSNGDRSVALIEGIESLASALWWLHRTHGVSQVRATETGPKASWSLVDPQAAAMTVIESERGILLLQRSPHDYLYPGAWTVPGGYVDEGEDFREAAKREILEETGMSIAPVPIGDVPITASDRLKAGVFYARVVHTAPRLSEHGSYLEVPLVDALTMNLTPEARAVLNQFADFQCRGGLSG